MITNREIVDVHLAYRHMKLSGNKRGDVQMMLPYYLMDVSYQVFCKDIKDYKCRHQAKRVKEMWRKSYQRFFADFFIPFDEDHTDFIIDQMDEFEDYIHNKVVMLKSTVMGVFTSEASFEEKKILASILVSNALAQMAQYIYGETNRNSHFQRMRNHHIAAVDRNSYEFAKLFPVSQNVDITSSDKVIAVIDSLCKDVVQFLKTKFDETQPE